jgi:hypothetical protein
VKKEAGIEKLRLNYAKKCGRRIGAVLRMRGARFDGLAYDKLYFLIAAEHQAKLWQVHPSMYDECAKAAVAEQERMKAIGL